MIPIVTPEEMAAIDAAAPEPVEVLIGRAGAAVARAAVDMLGGTYGRRVVVVAGRGNNGNDGRDAAARLRRRGVRVIEIAATDPPAELPQSDLVIDAAYGTGLSRAYEPPRADPSTPVLAVDIPSGVNGLTGEIPGSALVADRTVTFAALKPGLLLHPGAARAGDVHVVDIGLDVSSARTQLVTDGDVAAWLPARLPQAHKWMAACWAIAGSPGMTGAAHLAARAAYRANAGYVRLSSPGLADDPGRPTEVVGFPLPREYWNRDVTLADVDRFHAMLVGSGLGTDDVNATAVRRLLPTVPVPLVLDGDGLTAIAGRVEEVLHDRDAPTVLTPHDGEYTRLWGARPGPDRLEAARALASSARAVVLLKGPATVVADPDGRALVVDAGDQRLASAGTGDVLAGIITAFLAQGVDPLRAAAAGAHVHGRAAARAAAVGLVAGDIIDHLPEVLA